LPLFGAALAVAFTCDEEVALAMPRQKYMDDFFKRPSQSLSEEECTKAKARQLDRDRAELAVRAALRADLERNRDLNDHKLFIESHSVRSFPSSPSLLSLSLCRRRRR
jgi:hypothetical protein